MFYMLGWISTVPTFLRARTLKFYAGVNKIEAMCGRSRVNITVEPRSTFTFERTLSYIASILFTRVKFRYVRKKNLREIGNPPLGGPALYSWFYK